MPDMYFREDGSVILGKYFADLAYLQDFFESCGLHESISPECAEFLKLMPNVDPNERSSAQQLLEHSYMCLKHTAEGPDLFA